MDWSKAKNILIAALLITNLMLGTAIYRNNTGAGGSEQEQMKQNTILLLENHNIHVSEDVIPDRTERLPVMRVRYHGISQEAVNAAIASGEAVVSTEGDGENLEENYRMAAEMFLDLVGLTSDSFQFYRIETEGDVVTVSFQTIYEDFSLDHFRNEVTFRNGIPEDISRSWAEPVSMGQNRKRILPASEALIRFMTGVGSAEWEEEIQIDQIRLVYWLEGYTENSGVSEDTAVPYWCIEYNGEERAHIAAYAE